ncbi:MAG TPA: hypothetical protein VF656_15560 [Pyrinomonadaceae bacterium]
MNFTTYSRERGARLCALRQRPREIIREPAREVRCDCPPGILKLIYPP